MGNQSFGIIIIVLSVIVFTLSFLFYKKDKFNTALILIIAGGVVLRMYTCSDKYLHTWDEKYHALVAKNMIQHPLKPTLFDKPVFPYNYKIWVSNHVWLEKGPVPLLAISASIKLFGTNEFAVRLPSILISLLSVYLTFLIGSLLFNKKIGLLAAFLHSINGLLIELASGRVSSDHVETFFIFFVELGIFLSVLYVVKNRNSYLSVLIGIVAGLAVLCKWFPALIIFPIWIAATVLYGNISVRKFILHFAIAIFACLAILIPFFIYSHNSFPEEFAWVLKKYLFALSDIVENHSEPFYYYFIKIGVIFGELVYIPIILGIIRVIKNKSEWQLATLILWAIIPIIIFSFAETKRFTYLLISAPAFFLLISYYFFYTLKNLHRVKLSWLAYIFLVLLIGLPIRYCIERVKPFEHREVEPAWSADLKKINNNASIPENSIIFNVEHNIEAMFYSNYTVYDFIPAETDIQRLISEGYHVVINDNSKITDEIRKIKGMELVKISP
jgi:4-amino-4-deoxy-L-arabinose transferase